jgi:Outer membrane protein beta-barrel domain
MQRPWRPIVLAVALNAGAGAGMAAAQTVTVKNAPPGSAVELVLNAATVATTTASDAGTATLTAKMKDQIGKVEIDANVYVDVCEGKRRVLIVEVGSPTVSAEAGCDRRQVSGLYWVRPVNTVVVNLAGIAPTLLLIKGAYVEPALSPDGTTASSDGPRSWRPSPTGLMLSGGAGYSKFRDAFLVACGTVSPCNGGGSGLSYTASAGYWITRYLGVEGSYAKPKNMTADGGDTFKFDSTLDADVWTVAGLLGAPIGPVRLYGKAGVNYHQATSTTNETIDGVSQTFAFQTKGYGWLFGGGGEGWINSRVALFGEFSVVKIKGDAEGGGEAFLNDRLQLLMGGIRIHLGR